jgi:hypothetical protein
MKARIPTTTETVMIALPLRSDVAAAIVRCAHVEPHIMAAYVIDWQRRQREDAPMSITRSETT